MENDKKNKPFYKKWWVWVIAVVLLAAVFGNTNTNINSSDNVPVISKPTSVEDIDYMVLYNNSDAYLDKWVRISGKISSKDTNIADTKFITFRDGFDGITNMIYINIDSNLDENYDNYNINDYITIVGKVGRKTVGSLNIDNSYIEFGGEESQKKYDDLKLLEENKLIQNKENEKKNFIESCENYNYEDIARNPASYKGKNVKFTGKVFQVQEGTLNKNNITLLIYVTEKEYGLYEDSIYCEYTYSEGESKILEDDIVTFYGTSNGDTSYTSVLGQKITIPYVTIQYIELAK